MRDCVPMREQAVNACDSNIINALDFVAGKLCGDDGFLGDWHIASTGGNYRDFAFAIDRMIPLKHDRPRALFKPGAADDFLDSEELLA